MSDKNTKEDLEIRAFNAGYDLQRLAPEVAEHFREEMIKAGTTKNRAAFARGMDQYKLKSEKAKTERIKLNIDPAQLGSSSIEHSKDKYRSGPEMDKD
ncbi:MAG: hypothetical protein JJ975_05840 [Bacteroidia bacterium]|nr:hypothetical protein [Bacteroidia bacterium]